MAASAPTFSQLWVEEADALFQLGQTVPTSGTVVDIGTAQGGSAFIFHQATAGRHVAIHTYDPQPSREAYTHLAGTGVTICAQTSIEGARAWRERRPVDLLFIDGSHHLIDVIDDFNSWLPHLSPQGTVAFHDYDSVERGGLIHFGVHIAVDTLMAVRAIAPSGRVGRVVSGRVTFPTAGSAANITAADCLRTIDALVTRIDEVSRASYADRLLVGEAGALHDFLNVSLRLEGSRRVDIAEARTARRGNGSAPVVFARPLREALEALEVLDTLTADGHAMAGLTLLDNLTFCYLLEVALSANRSGLIEMCRDRQAFFKWEEVLATLDHSNGDTLSLRGRFTRLAPLERRAPLAGVSAFVAREQVRLVCLAAMFDAITGHRL